MVDIKFIRENLDAVKQNITNRNMEADPDQAIALADRRSNLIQEIDSLRQLRNENAQKLKGPMEAQVRQDLIDQGKKLKEQIPDLEVELKQIEEELQQVLSRIPNMAHPKAPIGKEDKDNLEIKRVGEPTTFSFTPKDHVELGEILDIIDFEAATQVTGPKFYYLKNQGVYLELGLIRYALDILQKKGFIPMITPDLAKEEVLEGIGFNPRGAESNIYTLEGTGTALVGTAEITLGGYHMNQILQEDRLPLLYAGVSHCFRREAGASGQFSKGLYRVHQFTKVEMFVYCTPETSEQIHEQLREIEEEIFSGLEIPFRVVDTCTGDLGAPAYRKYDLEAWMPGRGEQGDWGEVTSTSNCTDFQSRRLGVRFKGDTGKGFVHMLNGTAIAVSRGIISILENFQQEDGSVTIPKALQPYLGFDKILPKTR
jgi:seryl-tRNA synthetase